MHVEVPEVLTGELRFGDVTQITALRLYEAALNAAEDAGNPGTFRVTVDVCGSFTRTIVAKSKADAENQAVDSLTSMIVTSISMWSASRERRNEMAKAKLILTPGCVPETSVMIDGHELRGITKSVHVIARAGCIPDVVLQIQPTDISVDAAGTVILDNVALPDDLARQFYDVLKARFKE